ncbi:hypothetical protein OH76DRAFT_95757 [Lentinus brumalis]|uniref:Uncharacterized protein n=1 Tax=Lentinus brumalis TaxID=2498619 RepID=A0A371CQI4_9APHY|nr:hypothetical protein OH76DRAFT_95757 [Polyporus brumalis]
MFHGGNGCYPDFESITDLGRAAGAMICEDKSSWQDRISWKSYGCFEAARRTAHLNHDGSQEPTILLRYRRTQTEGRTHATSSTTAKPEDDGRRVEPGLQVLLCRIRSSAVFDRNKKRHL